MLTDRNKIEMATEFIYKMIVILHLPQAKYFEKEPTRLPKFLRELKKTCKFDVDLFAKVWRDALYHYN